MARRQEMTFYAPSEAGIQAAVLDHWLALGLPNTLVAAIPNAGALGQPGLTCGLADLMVMTPQIGVGFIELKRDARSHLSEAQEGFRELCLRLHVQHAVTYGRDEPIALLEEWSAVKRPAVVA
jgi:hypothetical protein